MPLQCFDTKNPRRYYQYSLAATMMRWSGSYFFWVRVRSIMISYVICFGYWHSYALAAWCRRCDQRDGIE